MLRGLVDEETLRGFVLDWQAREMVTKAGEVYVKTGAWLRLQPGSLNRPTLCAHAGFR